MKNAKIRTKLLAAFLAVALVTTVVGAVGICGMMLITDDFTTAFVEQTLPIPDISKIIDYTQRLRVTMRNAIIFTGDDAQLRTIETEMSENISEIEAYMRAFEPTINDTQSRTAFDDASKAYKEQFKPGILAILDGAKAGKDISELVTAMSDIVAAQARMIEDFDRCMSHNVQESEAAMQRSIDVAGRLLWIMIAIVVLGIVIAISAGIVIANMIATPITHMRTLMEQVGNTGQLEVQPELQANLEKSLNGNDEIGQSIEAMISMFMRLLDIKNALVTVAQGDLTGEISSLGREDALGESLISMQENLNRLFGEINYAASHMTIGSKQIADGAQSLAQGTTEQAASVQELSSSINEIAQQTKENAQLATQAAELSSDIRSNAERGSGQMNHMMDAVREINEASQSIGRVIKVIDDIAFQTNILALNAAVEAARAGQAGKGFAVVAEEVRALAAKSAEAAQDTGNLIENSIAKAELGVKIAGETAASLSEIVSGINESTEIVNNIAIYSEQQSSAIEQVNIGISQVAMVVQQNSATAEESAAASEEMNGQADMLGNLMAQFKLRGGVNHSALPTHSGMGSSLPSNATDHIDFDLDEYGKY